MVSINLPVITFLVIISLQLVSFLMYRFYPAKTASEVTTKNYIMLGLFLGGLGITLGVMVYIVYFKLNKIDQLVKNFESLK
jgi:hypothetical protein